MRGSLTEWTPQRALSHLLERLSRSDLSSHQAWTYLCDKGCPEEMAREALQYCIRKGFLDDQRLVELVTEKGRRVGWSQRRLQQEQKKRGLPVAGEVDESAACCQLAENWLSRGVAPEKTLARLLRRGFRHGQALSALRKVQEKLGESSLEG